MTSYDGWLEGVKVQLRSRSLAEIVALLERSLPQRVGRRGKHIADAFRKLNLALAKNTSAGERLLYEVNVPPRDGEPISELRSAFLDISYHILNLNPDLPRYFAQDLLNACTAIPTDLVLALSHSDSVAVLVQHNVANVSFEGCLQVLPRCKDTRSIYALKALRWCPCWEVAAPLIFDSLLSSDKAIAIAAHWVLAARASQRELVALCSKRGLPVPPDLLRTADVRNILATLIATLSKSWGDSNSD